MVKPIVLIALLLAATSCRHGTPEQFSKLTDEFVTTTLAFSPSGATATGLHEFQGQKLDTMLDDFSAASLDRQKKFYEGFRTRLAAFPTESLGPEERVDRTIMQDQIELALLELNEVQSTNHNPTLYVEVLGNALFAPSQLEYAPKAERMRHIIARLEKVPLFLDQANTNLVSAPRIWTDVALSENEGNLNLVDQTLRAAMPDDLKDSYARAAKPALDAIRKFQAYLKDSLASRDSWDWRLGGDRYPRKFKLVLETGVSAADTLQQAERDVATVRARMLELAVPIHRSFAAAHGDHEGPGRENQIISEVLAHIAANHATPATYLDDARKDLEEARQFVVAKHLLTMPPHANLQVIETPEFLRGIYAVGGFNSAPALEPQLGAFYWVTPIPKSWPPERAESKLREYNFYKLKLLTIHEAMPGHYVQAEFANALEPKPRRLLRAVYGNGPYVEGWAQYATQTMLDEGFLNHSPELRLTFLKEELRVLANAIIDIRLQMLNMTDQEALDLMQQQTFQEVEEATAKLQRAKLSSCQLPTYYVGWRGWLRVREQFQKEKGAAYQLSEFNDHALAHGAVPLTVLGDLLH